MKRYRFSYAGTEGKIATRYDSHGKPYLVETVGFYDTVRLIVLDSTNPEYETMSEHDRWMFLAEEADSIDIEGMDSSDPRPYERAEKKLLSRNGLTLSDIEDDRDQVVTVPDYL